MTTENIFQDTEESRIAQQKRDTLHDLLRISMDYQGPLKFVDVDVKAIAKKVNEAYDELGNNYTVAADPTVNPLAGLVIVPPGGNVMNMLPGSDASKTATAGTAAQGGSSFKVSKKEYAKGGVFGLTQEQIDLINQIQEKGDEILEAHASLFVSIRDRQTFLLEVVTSWQAVLDGPALLSAGQVEEAITNRNDAQEELKLFAAADRCADDIRSGIMALECLKSL